MEKMFSYESPNHLISRSSVKNVEESLEKIINHLSSTNFSEAKILPIMISYYIRKDLIFRSARKNRAKTVSTRSNSGLLMVPERIQHSSNKQIYCTGPRSWKRWRSFRCKQVNSKTWSQKPCLFVSKVAKDRTPPCPFTSRQVCQELKQSFCS